MGGKGIHIDLTIDDSEVEAYFAELAGKVTDLKPVMTTLGEVLVEEAHRSFDLERDPETGGSWAPGSPATVMYRQRGGKYPGEILALSGRLKSSIHATAHSDRVEVGTDVIYGAVHQLGADFSVVSTRRRVRIPARPYLGVSQEGWAEITATVLEYLEE